jgi:hypothetical protein
MISSSCPGGIRRVIIILVTNEERTGLVWFANGRHLSVKYHPDLIYKISGEFIFTRSDAQADINRLSIQSMDISIFDATK